MGKGKLEQDFDELLAGADPSMLKKLKLAVKDDPVLKEKLDKFKKDLKKMRERHKEIDKKIDKEFKAEAAEKDIKDLEHDIKLDDPKEIYDISALLGKDRNKEKLKKLKAVVPRNAEEALRIKEKIERLEKKIEIAKISEPKYSSNQIRHKKYHEVKEAREDLSKDVKAIINKLQNEGEYKLATYHGRAGAGRKLLKCPHCEGVMLATGVKLKREVNPDRPKTQGQREWLDYVKQVSLIPEYKGLARSKVLKAASELRGKGISISDLSARNRGHCDT
jgi:hypothetical protein